MYCTVAEVREVGTQITASAEPPAPDAVLRKVIERASRLFDMECGVSEGYFEPALYPIWESTHDYVVGDIVTPTTRNEHQYRVTKAGTSGSSEPTFPASGTVASGSVIFTENEADVVPSERTFYGDGTNHLRLIPYVAGTLDTLTMPSGYTVPEYVAQNGSLIIASDGLIRLPVNGGWVRGVPVTVKALWGFSATPADVKHAVIEWVINLWRETDPAALKLTSLEQGPLREAIPPRVKDVAMRWRVKAGLAFV